jgi:hypothetical protein
LQTYLFCGLNVISNITIRELTISRTDEVGFIFSLKSSRQQLKDYPWTRHWTSPSGEKMISYSKKDHHWLRFPDLADFQIASQANEIACYPISKTPQETIRHLLLDQVLPRCLAHQGRTMVHASAVQLEHGLILFIGDSGTGKSTLAGNFHQAGQPVVSDDCLWIKEGERAIKAVPTYGGLRLWDDSLQVLFPAEQNIQSMAHYSTKKRVLINEGDARKFMRGIPILAVIVLSPVVDSQDSEITLEQLSNREAFIALMKQSFQLDVLDIKRMTRHIRAVGRIVPRIPTYRLSMPHEYALLPLVRQKILETVQK